MSRKAGFPQSDSEARHCRRDSSQMLLPTQLNSTDQQPEAAGKRSGPPGTGSCVTNSRKASGPTISSG
jgi:hypothetical protein